MTEQASKLAPEAEDVDMQDQEVSDTTTDPLASSQLDSSLAAAAEEPYDEQFHRQTLLNMSIELFLEEFHPDRIHMICR